ARDAVGLECPFRPRQISPLTRPPRNAFDRVSQAVGRNGADENILRVAAVEKYSIVPRRRYQAQRAGIAFRQREAEIEILDENPLAVVAELRDHDERYGRFMDDGVGPQAGTEADLEVPMANRYAIRGWGVAAVPFPIARGLSCRARALSTIVRRRGREGLALTVRG